MKKPLNPKTMKGLRAAPNPEQSSTEVKSQIDFALHRANRVLNTEQLLALHRKEAPRFYELAEVFGKWVWIQFPEKQPAEATTALSQCGFHWNNQRQTWQHPCGTLPERQEFDPRKRYGSQFAADQKPA